VSFLIIDGNSILNRTFYAIKPLSNNQSNKTNGIFGFLNVLRKFIVQIGPKYIAVAFDVSRKTFRTNIYSEYKGTRPSTPPDLIWQLSETQDLLALMGYSVIKCPGFEADDILGTISKNNSPKVKCKLLTGDRDAYQLIEKNVDVIFPTVKSKSPFSEIVTLKVIIDKYGVQPEALIDVKALAGDPSDNIPGCKGIGEKTALTLISQFGNIETIYENINQIASKTLQQKLKDSKAEVFLSKTLATINQDVPIDWSLEAHIPKKTDVRQLLEKLTALEMKTAIEKINLLCPHLQK
jgi:DNA polymerase-1